MAPFDGIEKSLAWSRGGSGALRGRFGGASGAGLVRSLDEHIVIAHGPGQREFRNFFPPPTCDAGLRGAGGALPGRLRDGPFACLEAWESMSTDLGGAQHTRQRSPSPP